MLLNGETDLSVLLRTMSPSCDGREYVYCAAPNFSAAPDAWALVREKEGVTAIMERKDADALGLGYGTAFAKITLEVHSSLDAVGLTAAVSTALAERGIGANVVAALRHDHAFVPYALKDEALDALATLAERSARRE